MRHYIFPILMAVLTAATVLVVVKVGKSSASRAIDAPEFSVHEYHKDGITYLVFKTQSGVAVVNYTSDSSEWIFLHTPTK